MVSYVILLVSEKTNCNEELTIKLERIGTTDKVEITATSNPNKTTAIL